MYIGQLVLHHVVGEHEWADGEYLHGPLTETEAHKTCLEKDSKAMEALRNVVMDPRFVKTLHHCYFQVLVGFIKLFPC